MTAEEEARARLRAAVGRVLNVFVSVGGTADQLNEWAGVSEQFANRLEGRPPDSVLWGYGSNGVLSVASMPPRVPAVATLAATGERFEGMVTFSRKYEGHTGFVHGGVIACVFDEVLGVFQTFVRPPVVTAELRIRYLAPTPLGEPIHFDAAVTERGARKMLVLGHARHGDTVCAEAEAVFVITRPDSIVAMNDRGES